MRFFLRLYDRENSTIQWILPNSQREKEFEKESGRLFDGKGESSPNNLNVVQGAGTKEQGMDSCESRILSEKLWDCCQWHSDNSTIDTPLVFVLLQLTSLAHHPHQKETNSSNLKSCLPTRWQDKLFQTGKFEKRHKLPCHKSVTED